MTNSERTNEAWLADLRAEGPTRDAALQDLLSWLQRRLLYFLRDRSDLASRDEDELRQLAGDFAQESVLMILQNLDQFAGRSKFTTWATKIAMNQALGELRRARWRDFSLEQLTAQGDFEPIFLGADQATPERQAVRQAVLDTVMNVLQNEISPRQRQALYARLVLDVPIELLAQHMETNVNALYKLIHDARKRLKARLQEHDISTEEALAAFA